MAFDIVRQTIEKGGSASKGMLSDMAKLLSKLGASKGGKARRDKLTPEKRKLIALNAAKARWHKKD